MDPRRGLGGPFFNFNDPFGGFGGFGGPGDFMSSFVGGRSPFDDPFFTRPFGSILQPGFLGSGGPSPFPNFPQGGFLENQVQPNRSRGPIIEEINPESDDEKEENGEQKNVKSRKHPRSYTSKEPYVEYPDEVEERKRKQVQSMNQISMLNNVQMQPQAHSFTYQSSSFTYGGADGAYYTSSKARRIGSDGLTFEEKKEADSRTGEASHHISRGLYNKGHSLLRKLKSDGKVDTMQTLHNLNEGELAEFEADWHGKAKKQMPQLAQSFVNQGFIGSGNRQTDEGSQSGWALPSTELRDQSRQPVYSGPAEQQQQQQPRRIMSNVGKKNTPPSIHTAPSMSKNVPSRK